MPKRWPQYALNASFVWYLAMTLFHYERLGPSILAQAAGLSAIVGTLLAANASGPGSPPLSRRQIARFYLIPFCVASFTAVTAPAGFVLVFSPELAENLVAAALAILAAFLSRGRKV